MPDDRTRIAAILDFWFGAPGTPERDLYRRSWFQATPELDASLRRLFGAGQAEAATGALDHWALDRDGALALVLLLDQLPRNLFRGRPEAFACDAKAREIAREALARGFDRGLPAMRCLFFYMPFEHSEISADQDFAVGLFDAMPACPEKARMAENARRRRDGIARFGRWPLRNKALGRVSTPEEEQFIREREADWAERRAAEG